MTTTFRRSALLVVGIGVAAIVLIAATQMLLLSFESSPLIGRDRLADLINWIERRPTAGAGVLGGGALVLLALVLTWSIGRSFGADRRVITTRRRSGWTKLDRATLEDAIERDLEGIDRRNDVSVRVRRSGRIDLDVVTPDPTATGPVQELREAIDAVSEDRSLPCRSGRIRASIPRRMTGRRRVR